MNKRLRKKQLKRAVCGLIAACDEYLAARERIYRKATQDVLDAHGKSNEEFSDALRRFMEIASIMASSGLPSKRV
jgi:hypothetical protein